MVILKKVKHRGIDCICFDFPYNSIILKKLKKIDGIRWSKTLNCWYSSYTKIAYNQFLKLELEHRIYTSGTTEVIASQGDLTGIDKTMSTSVQPTVNTASEAAIPTKKEINIVYNSDQFCITIPYVEKEIKWLKSLDKSWWNSKYGTWNVKANINNLVGLQERYGLWSKEEYQFIDNQVRKYENPCSVELYLSPVYQNMFCVKIRGYKVDVDYLKQVPDRNYLKDGKIWLLPFEDVIVANLIKHYNTKNTKVINRIAIHGESYKKRPSPYKQVQQQLLNKLDGYFLEKMSTYITTMTAQRYSVQTIKSYSIAFLKYIQYYKNLTVDSHTEIEVNKYLAQISLNKLSFSSINMSFSAIKFYFEKVIYKADFQLDSLKRPRKGRYLPTILSIQEVDRLLRSTDNLKHLTILYTLYSSGMRLGEILNIRILDIHWDRNQIHIKSGKGNKDRMVMLSSILKEVLQKYFDAYTPIYWLFEGQDRKTQYSSSSVQKIVKKAYLTANITRKVTPHTLRHCFATHLLDSGTDIRYIQELLGHKDIKTTLIYTHVTTRKIQEIQSPLDRLMSEKNHTFTK